MALKVVSWNCKVGRDQGVVGDSLKEIIDTKNPQVVLLQEAGGYVDMLRDRFDHAWFVYAKGGWDESMMCPVLVRKQDHNRKEYDVGWDTLRTHTSWTGPQGGVHRGRTWTWVKCEGVLYLSLHRCTSGNDKNKAAFREEYDVLVKFLNNRSEPIVVMGDHNCGSKKEFPGASRLIAQAVGGKVRADTDDPGIDYGITVDVKGEVYRMDRSFGSDHEPTVFKPS